MSSDPAPYNITISSQCGTITYLPARDGPLSTGWNVSYSGYPDSAYQQQLIGAGTSAHRTTLTGATLQFQWVGTAAFLYGTAASGSYSVAVDGGAAVAGPADSGLGLLNRFVGLQYANHTIVLNVTGSSEVSFEGAVLTIGMGDQGAVVTNTTQFAATSSGSGNTFFTFSPNWGESVAYTQTSNGTLVPNLLQGMTTATTGATLSYSVSNATAFFLMGTMNYDHLTYSVQFNPHDDPTAVKNLQLNDISRWFTQDEILYWESGLDMARKYDVLITNTGSGASSFTFYNLVLMDAVGPESGTSTITTSFVATPSTTTLALPSTTTTTTTTAASRSKISTGAIAGISLGIVALLVISIIAIYLLKRRRRLSSTENSLDPQNLLAGPVILDDTVNMRGSTVIRPGSVYPYNHDAPPVANTYNKTSPTADTHSVSRFAPHSDTGTPSADGFTIMSSAEREVDAGPLVGPSATLPPGYDPLWTESRNDA